MTILPEKEDTETHTQDIDYAVSFDAEAYHYQNRFRTYKIKSIDFAKVSLVLPNTEYGAAGNKQSQYVYYSDPFEGEVYDLIILKLIQTNAAMAGHMSLKPSGKTRKEKFG